MLQNSYTAFVVMIFASITWANTVPMSEETHRSDLQVMRAWNRHEKPLPGEDIITRMAAWIREHPEDAESLYLLSTALSAGFASPDTEELDPIDLLKRAAAGGHPQAVSLLGFMMVRGDGVPADPDGGIALIQRAVEQGVIEAKHHLGTLYLLGEGGIRRDPEKAKQLLSDAARAGLVRSWVPLSIAHLMTGEHDAAREAMTRGAEGGDPQAQWNLGRSYLEGGVFGHRSPTLAFRWIRAACEHPSAEPDWQRELGYMYQRGIGTAVDLALAEKHIRLAADADDIPAMLWLVYGHLSGNLSDADPAKGLTMLEELSRQEVAESNAYLGELYLQGLWVERDLQRARQYFKLAAEQGDEPSRDRVRAIDAALDRGFR